MRRTVLFALWGVLALMGAACTSKSTTQAPTTPAATTPAASPTLSATPPTVTLGYYDSHQDAYISTDVSDKSQAAAMHLNYSPGLAKLNPKAFPLIYMTTGQAAPNQITVFGSEPGESDYSPVWDEATVTWKAGVTPALLTGDNQINGLAAKGKLTVQRTSILLNCPIIGVRTSSASTPAVLLGYYDSHQDAFVNTDVSTKAEASTQHVNYSPGLATLKAGNFPPIYMVSGPAAPGQLTVFGSQPGESDYSPLWDELTVTWKSGVTPVLLTSDNQINDLATKGMLSLQITPVLLNCPIIAVGKG